jgi:signal transduction histidine kinase
VTLIAMLLVGTVVTELIEQAVTRNSAATTALYVDSIIAPILPDLTTTEQLDDSVERALDETLGQGALGRRLMSFRLWRGDGTILYSNDKNLMGKKVTPNENLRQAFAGHMVAEFDHVDDEESGAERQSGQPLLEIYNPVLQPWSGEVVAVSEFYEVATDFETSLNHARLRSWAAVAAVTAGFFLLLSAIVLRGSKTIDRQRSMLAKRVEELTELLRENKSLSTRVQKASQQTASLNERYLRRIAADLHDGPAQLVAYASLRVDSDMILDCKVPRSKRANEVATIKTSLEEAMREIRSICHGLVLPEIDGWDVSEILQRVVSAYRSRTGAEVELVTEHVAWNASPAEKICLYRFVQEALNNGWRHAGGKGLRVMQRLNHGCLTVAVTDSGPGFDAGAVKQKGLGLSGLRERIESLGGRFDILSSSDGTTLTMSLKICEQELV